MLDRLNAKRDIRTIDRVLEADRDRASNGLIRTFMSKVMPKCYPFDAVLKWLEADPSRRKMTARQIQKAVFQEMRVVVCRTSVNRAVRRFDSRYGAPQPPFDRAAFVTLDQAAGLLGVKPAKVGHLVRAERLGGLVWQHKLYVSRASITAFCAGTVVPELFTATQGIV